LRPQREVLLVTATGIVLRLRLLATVFWKPDEQIKFHHQSSTITLVHGSENLIHSSGCLSMLEGKRSVPSIPLIAHVE
jgi:hypothetical protein